MTPERWRKEMRRQKIKAFVRNIAIYTAIVFGLWLVIGLWGRLF